MSIIIHSHGYLCGVKHMKCLINQTLFSITASFVNICFEILQMLSEVDGLHILLFKLMYKSQLVNNLSFNDTQPLRQ